MHKIRAAFLALVAALAVFAMCVGSSASTAPVVQITDEQFVAMVARVIILTLDGDEVIGVVLVSATGEVLPVAAKNCEEVPRCVAAVKARIADGNVTKINVKSRGVVAT